MNQTVSSDELLRRQQAFFRTGATLDLKFRTDALRRFCRALEEKQDLLCAALQSDLGKSDSEGYMTEVGQALSEAGFQRRHLKRWAAPRRVPTSLVNAFGSSCTIAEPLGSVLIMAPWNYPVMLSFEPLAGAVAAGNTVILKPSAYAPAASHAIAALIAGVFPPEHVAVVEGGRKENQDLLDLPFDHIFFTGSVAVGRTVLEHAARNLTPVTLELGGKSPVIVERSSDIRSAARRIVFGKLLNSGQTCIAPDYVLAERGIHDELIEALKQQFSEQCPDPLASSGFSHLVNSRHFHRLLGLIDREKVVYGGGSDEAALKLEPTILDGVTPEDAVMQEEIFGPILPVLTVENMEEAKAFVTARPKPLAMYIFTRDAVLSDRLLREIPSGGACVNDTISHILSSRLPFGGTGMSGMGKYHGLYSFRTFSNEKAVVRKYLRPDLPLRYTPYKNIYEKVVRLVLR